MLEGKRYPHLIVFRLADFSKRKQLDFIYARMRNGNFFQLLYLLFPIVDTGDDDAVGILKGIVGGS